MPSWCGFPVRGSTERAGRRPRLLVLFLLLIGCTERPGMDILTPITTAPAEARGVTVHVATTRERRSPEANGFTNRRARDLNFAEYTVSVPPNHRPGRIEWPRIPADPAVSFAPLRDRVLGRDDFEAALAGRGCGEAAANTLVFVHGYNTNFPEALFRVVQMAHDTDNRLIPILFAWPSDAATLGYVADRDSAIYSRDYLADLLARLTQICPRGQITLVGHSMGGWLTVEALRQLRLAGRDAVLARLHVALASPDIDIDVFRTQMQVIGPLTPPMTVLVSRDDRALSVSSQLSGARQRLGLVNVHDPEVQEAARAAQLNIVDISGLEASDSFNHDRYVSFAGAYARMAATGRITPGAGLRQAGAFIFNTVGTVIASPFVAVGQALAPE
ncbi:MULTISPECIES: alpha/beta hydrolase [Roseomonadaceae]|uniref:Alpha/beta fold hydrolase n=1 Tax=Falsiroseomonas oleicola TaxID=2801474 RepID=A0ABS6HDV6_9PROT|nr:alpha/beta fold hydrolase [Roseomonas oleicola]MBU8546915.1 alpha/beta fold hydrolase [Roseomonas oleicola]